MATDVPGWETREWKGGRVKFAFMLLIGLLALVAGIGMSISGRGDERGAGIGVLAFGLALVAAAPLFRSWRRHGQIQATTAARPGGYEPAILFPYSRVKTAAAVLGGAAFAITMLAMFVFAGAFDDAPGGPAWVRALTLIGFVFFGALSLRAITRGLTRKSFVALTPSGIVNEMVLGSSFVPWDAIEEVNAFEMSIYTRGTRTTEAFVGLIVNDRDRVEASRFGKMLMRMNRPFGADISYPVRTLDVEPALLYWTIRYYFEHPNERPTIGGAQSLELATRDGGSASSP